MSGARASGALPASMLNPNGALQRVVPCGVTARVRAYSAYGCPVIHGSAIGIVVAGTLSAVDRESVDHTSVRSSNVVLVASWNW